MRQGVAAFLLAFIAVTSAEAFYIPSQHRIDDTGRTKTYTQPINDFSLIQNDVRVLRNNKQVQSSNSQPQFSSIGRVLRLVGRQAFYLYIGCLVLVIRLPFSLSIPHFVSASLGALGKADFHSARQNILLLLAMGTIDAVLDFWCVVLFGLTNQKIVKHLRVDLFSAILKQDMAFFDSSKSPDIASRLSNDCSAVGSDLSWFFRFS